MDLDSERKRFCLLIKKTEMFYNVYSIYKPSEKLKTKKLIKSHSIQKIHSFNLNIL